jgi:hypothetical protein
VFENAAPVWGTYLNNVFDLVDVKYQTNQAGDVFENARSVERLTANIGEYFNRGKQAGESNNREKRCGI